MKKVGLTGGIGSGKSFIADLFAALGIPVFYADLEARNLMNTDRQLVADISNHFGKQLYVSGQLDRAALAGRVFQKPGELKWLNELVHPAVHRAFTIWVAEMQTFCVPYVMEEAAILFESGAYKAMDLAIHVKAPVDVRIDRVRKRDNLSSVQVQERMRNQWTDDQRSALADFEIINDGRQMILPQIIAIDTKLREKHG